ncbi:prepilin peptidase [Pseudomonas sp. P66]|uniref:Prepilin leader peptidase/N-methyltransferase n=1 Tax=Pseudomonas arcuscaelestis TaxID=2710591 RepID=A0ABS2BZL9_9PSED|nr:A24 family peptidase [Pseudomonas arcuscaelestis]MBM5459059.1 prepilin peptidase [Pseudomonas arcuscaelestis]
MATLELLKYYPVAFATIAGIVGLLVGSFLNVVVYRLPEMMKRAWLQDAREALELPLNDESTFNLAVPNSRCPCCGHAIRPWENIPVISWLVLRAKCSGCYSRISIRYPLVELSAAALTFATAWHFGFGLQAAFAIVMIWGAIALFLIDLDEMLLPDAIVMPGIWIGLTAAYLGVFTSLQDGFIGAVAGYLLLALPAGVFALLRGRQGMGNGDFKLMALFGAWLGWQALPIILLLSAVSGAIIGTIAVRARGTPYPFGPFIIVGGLMALFYEDELYALYSHVSGVNIGAIF